MSQLPSGCIVRRPGLGDASTVLELQLAVEAAEYGDPETTLEDLLDQWDDIDLEQDAWLVYTSEGRLVGYAAVLKDNDGFMFDFYTHPEAGVSGLNTYLLEQCERRARAQLAEGATLQAAARTIIPHTNLANRQFVEAAGYAVRQFHFRMQIDLDSSPPPPNWPKGVMVRTISPGLDERRVYALIQAAFERPGRIPLTFENWRGFMMRPDHFSPDLWFLAYCGDDLVGAALCFDYPQHGWVRQLGVTQSWRKQGLGSALLQHSFGVFYQRGHKQVALGVSSENPNAYSLYEKIGMRRVRQYDEYQKDLSETQ
jgi:ribosomal protein S18 acetylase RimI-like enzyme